MKLVCEIALSRHIPKYLKALVDYITPTKGYIFEESEFTTFITECRKIVSRQHTAQRNALQLKDIQDAGFGNITITSPEAARYESYVRIKYIDIKGTISFSPNKSMYIEPYLL